MKKGPLIAEPNEKSNGDRDINVSIIFSTIVFIDDTTHTQIHMLLLCEDFSRILVIFRRIVSNIQHDRTTEARLSRRKNTFSMVGGKTCGSFETVTRVSSTFELNGCFKQRDHAHENKDQDDVENFLMTRNFSSLKSSDCRVGNE